MMSSSVNLRELYFEYKDLSQIQGEPTFESMHKMLLEIKTNCISVPCSLCGGTHEYAGIIPSPSTYATLAPMTPFIIPTHPDILQVNPGVTQYAIALAKIQYDESIKQFSEYQLIQRSLLQQVTEAIDGNYITCLRNWVTGKVPTDIRKLILSLFMIYGKFSTKKIRENFDDVATMQYDITDPIDIIFNEVDNLREIAELAMRPYTEVQLVDRGYIIFGKLPICRYNIRKWIRRNPANQT